MPDLSLKNLTIPVSMLTSIIAVSALITGTRSDLDHLTSRVDNFREDLKESDSDLKNQDERLSRMEGKQDLILHTIQQLEKRFSNE